MRFHSVPLSAPFIERAARDLAAPENRRGRDAVRWLLWCRQGPCGDPAEPGWAAEMGRTEVAPWGGGKASHMCVSMCPSRLWGHITSQRGAPQWAGKQEPWACSKLQEHSGTHPAPSGEGSGWVSVSLSALGSIHLSLGASICPWGRPSASPVPWGSVAVCVLSHYRALAVASLACYSRNK